MTRALVALSLLLGAPDFAELEKSSRQAVDDSDWKTVRRTVDVMADAAPERAARFLSNEFTFAVPNIEIMPRRGKRYAKLIRTESDPETGEARGQTFVHSFVEIETGDIFKAATFKAAAKHARGNIYLDAGRASMTESAHIKYLR